MRTTGRHLLLKSPQGGYIMSVVSKFAADVLELIYRYVTDYSPDQPRDDHGRWTSIFVNTEEKETKNAAGKSIKFVTKTTLEAEPNSITQKVNAKGGIDRNFYDEKGKQYLQISNNDHGRPKQHPFGKKGEHGHDYTYTKDKVIRGNARALTAQEEEDNKDLL